MLCFGIFVWKANKYKNVFVSEIWQWKLTKKLHGRIFWFSANVSWISGENGHRVRFCNLKCHIFDCKHLHLSAKWRVSFHDRKMVGSAVKTSKSPLGRRFTTRRNGNRAPLADIAGNSALIKQTNNCLLDPCRRPQLKDTTKDSAIKSKEIRFVERTAWVVC